MVCLECSKEFKAISNTHLKKCCGMTIDEYRTKHSVTILCDESVRLKSVGENNPNYKDGNTYTELPCSSCEEPTTGRGSTGLCVKCSVSGELNPFYGKNHTEGTKAKLVEAHKSRDKSTYKAGNASSEVISAAQKKYWSTIPKKERAAKIRPFIAAGHKHCKKNKNTKIEQAAYSVLKKYPDVLQNTSIEDTPYYVDFLIPSINLIVECYGDYWHCNPRKYDAEFYNKSLHMTSQDKWDKDNKRLQCFHNLGFKTLVVWEDEDIPKRLQELLDENT